MILISDDHWSTTRASALVLPCDRSGVLNRGLVLEASNFYKKPTICQRYHQVARHLDERIELYWDRSGTPTVFIYFSVAPTLGTTPSSRDYWKSFELLKEWADRFDAATIAFPIMFTRDVNGTDQCEMIRFIFGEWERSDSHHFTVHIPVDDSDEIVQQANVVEVIG